VDWQIHDERKSEGFGLDFRSAWIAKSKPHQTEQVDDFIFCNILNPAVIFQN